jgi:hypothetical protein
MNPQKNVLVAEHYSHDQWGRAYAIYEGLTEVGLIIGLGIGFVTFTTTISFGINAMYSFYACSTLSLISFLISLIFVADPLMNLNAALWEWKENSIMSTAGSKLSGTCGMTIWIIQILNRSGFLGLV